MSYTPSSDFIALVRASVSSAQLERMPGLDFVVAALSRAGMIRLWVSQTPPIVDQPTTVWLRPAMPSWSAEGVVFLWDGTLSTYVVATPELWTSFNGSFEIATEAQAVVGLNNTKIMTPLRTKQQLDALRAFATEAQAEDGLSGDTVLSPLTGKQALDSQRPYATQSQAEVGVNNVGVMTPLRTRQQLDALRAFASQAEAEAGNESAKVLSPLTGRQLTNVWAQLSRFVGLWTGSIVRTIRSKLTETVSVKDYGAIGDGTKHTVAEWLPPNANPRYASLAALQVDYPFVTATTDGIDWAAFQAAVRAVATSKITRICVPSGMYVIDKSINIDGAAALFVGDGWNFGTKPSDAQGSCILSAITDGSVMFQVSATASRGSGVKHVAFYQTHPTPAPGWAPTNYNFLFTVMNTFGEFILDDVFLCGINRFVFCDNSGRLNVRRIYGQVFTQGIYIDRAFDACRINDIHFWNYWSEDNAVMAYQQATCNHIELLRTDTTIMNNVFLFAGLNGLYLTGSGSGVTTKLQIGNISVDFVKYGIHTTGVGVSAQIANITAQCEAWPSTGAGIPGGLAIYAEGGATNLQIGNLQTERNQDQAIRVKGTDSRVQVGNAIFNLFNQSNTSKGAVLVDSSTSVVLFGTHAETNSNSGPLKDSGSPANTVYFATMTPA